MFDVSKKINTLRTATVRAVLKIKPETRVLLESQKLPKGDPIPVAKVAAIQAAKNTSQIIPYCHPLPVDHVDVAFDIAENQIAVTVTVKAIYKTGVEMEALTAASVAVLTLYDMMKMVDETMVISEITLLKKSGGKSDFTTRFDKPLRAAVVVMSDSISSGKKTDLSGQLIVERLKKEKIEVVEYLIIPDDVEKIIQTLIEFADNRKFDLVMTTGGTGFSPRDCTPEAMMKVIDREITGIPESVRAYGQERTPYSMLSRAKAGLRGNTLIVNLPGSKKGVADSLEALFPALLHSFKMIWGGGH